MSNAITFNDYFGYLDAMGIPLDENVDWLVEHEGGVYRASQWSARIGAAALWAAIGLSAAQAIRGAVPWSYGRISAMGETDIFGNITIRHGLTGRQLSETIRHEAVHRFFSPTRGAFRTLRARLGGWAYENVHSIKYLEEFLAELNGTRNVFHAAAHPLAGGYGLSISRMAIQTVLYFGTLRGVLGAAAE